MDCDQIVCGDLSYIWETKDYDVAGVLNYNRLDAQTYGAIGGWFIHPMEYFNCGLVAMRSEKFIRHWKAQCFTEQFNRSQFKEQDMLNALIYFGNYNARCLDHQDPIGGNNAWWGIFGKADWGRAILKDKKIIIPK